MNTKDYISRLERHFEDSCLQPIQVNVELDGSHLASFTAN